ncbi:hypothetical protein [Fructilactobacillus florum]|uniref:hypothetical protein n=1 Tax=Fructilactobacillus florum TaxID=640331 RepID=UPI0006D06D3D|nr:hypothetical protein [Fructilactobacillus florum]
MIKSRDEWYEAIHKLEEKYASENGKGVKIKSMICVPDDDPLLKEVQQFSQKNNWRTQISSKCQTT